MLGCLPREIATDEENWIFFFGGRGEAGAERRRTGAAQLVRPFASYFPSAFSRTNGEMMGKQTVGRGPLLFLPEKASKKPPPSLSSFPLSSPPTPLCIAGGKGAKKIESSEQTAPAKISGLTRAGLGVYIEVEKLV